MNANKFIPSEIYTEILSYLPVKSLLRFRSVCKDWNSIIDNSEFASSHLRHYSSNHLKSHVLVCDRVNPMVQCFVRKIAEFDSMLPPREPNELLMPLPNGYGIIGELNGLFLIANIMTDIFLWNPSIRKRLNIPPPPSSVELPELSIGFDPASNDYKVVSLLFKHKKPTLEIFSLKSRSWKIESCICADIELGHHRSHSKRIYFQGSLHSVGRDRNSPYNFFFVSFNLTSKTFSVTPFPQDLYKRVGLPKVVGGEFFVGLLSQRRDAIEIWVLEIDRSWNKRYTLDTSIWTLRLCIRDPPCTLIWPIGNNIKNGVFIWGCDEPPSNHIGIPHTVTSICFYDTNTGKKSIVSGHHRPCYIGTYTESLVLLS